MKTLMNLLVAMFLVIATGNAQTGNADVQRGYGWTRTGIKGQISKLVWGGDWDGTNPLPTGQHIILVDGKEKLKIWVLRAEVDGSYLVRFKRGFYSSRTTNWVKVYRGQALWGFGTEPIFRKGLDGATYITNAEALDECGNPVAQVMRASCSPATTTVVTVGGNNSTNNGGGCNSNTNNTSTTTTTPPVTGGTWPGMTQQPPQPQNFSLPQPERRKSWLARNWWVIPVGLLAGYGGYRLITDKKPTAGHETNNDPDPAHEPNGRPAPSWGPAPGGIILRF